MTAESSCPGKVREKAGGEAWGLQRVLRVSHALSSEDLGPYERGRGVAKAAFQGDWWGLCAGVGQQPGHEASRRLAQLTLGGEHVRDVRLGVHWIWKVGRGKGNSEMLSLTELWD